MTMSRVASPILTMLAVLSYGACSGGSSESPAPGSRIGLAPRFALPTEIHSRFLPSHPFEAHAVLLEDLDGDRRPDLVFEDAVFWNEPLRGHYLGPSLDFELVSAGGIGPRRGVPLDVAAGDFDGDGEIDLLFARREGVVLMRNAGSRRFVDVTATSLPPDPGGRWRARVGDFDGDGDLDAFLLGADNGWLLVNSGAGIFTDQTAQRLPAGAPGGSDAAFGDIDGDGDTDLLIATRATRTEPGLRVLLNDGSGRFVARSSAATPPFQSVSEVEVVDLDGDVDLDLALVDSLGLRLFANDGAGNFSVPVALRSGVSRLLVVDEDGDGFPDLATYDHPDVLRFRNLGQLTFRGESVLGEPHGRPGAWADVDGNGRPDFVTSKGRVLFCQQDFEQWTYVVEDRIDVSSVEGLEVGDLDGDSTPDAAVVGSALFCSMGHCYPLPPRLLISFNDGRAQFRDTIGPLRDPSLSSPRIHLGDLDGDGWSDIVADQGYLRNEGGGRFVSWYPLPGPLDGALGDLDGDGDLDVLRAEPSLRVLRNDGGSPQVVLTDVTASRLIGGGAAVEVVLTDLDGDAALDVVSLRPGGTVVLHANDGTGTLRAAAGRLPPQRAAATAIAVADLDRDGHTDLLVAEELRSAAPVQIWWNDGLGGFLRSPPSVPRLIAGVVLPREVACGDLDADGMPDVFVRGQGGATQVSLFALRNDGGRSFSDANGVAGAWMLHRSLWPLLRAADLDGDGDADLLSGHRVLLGRQVDFRARNRAFAGTEFLMEIQRAPNDSGGTRLALPLVATGGGVREIPGLGVLRLDPGTLAALPTVPIPAPAGVGLMSLGIPARPVLIGQDLHLQCLLFDLEGSPGHFSAPFVERVGY